ncbi:serine protease DegP, putative [Plasmodium knowlesi strain H]|uniref:Serine protease DegP, putative n=3 Tax=Plasmodium knowlesi TaxID=5850 RepID=A0A5E7WU41_PLAKH|nr:serine protease DegP, putative [Plasmodium knowlesi strain H]OTN68629.1 putative Serine protease DegP [Plasmodium knowlesi]CAA9986191.1 serine protease DegP, putative [Plasmodium knowlesi strain H]SBO25392.1 serine protease DegP, putative [Plasmodium knowlesi strain H]SBO27685.1 serine protease DegP, putative [Plasmodium knowlesi strain H]VVS75665.1 serine protease DegP, putative [Plasmodium knowlesi strain H]
MKLSLLSYSFCASVAALLIIRDEGDTSGSFFASCAAWPMGERAPRTDGTNYTHHNRGELTTEIGLEEEHLYNDTETQGGDDSELVFNKRTPSVRSKSSTVDPPFVKYVPAYVNLPVNYKPVAKMNAAGGEEESGLPLSDIYKEGDHHPSERTKDGQYDPSIQQYEVSFKNNTVEGEYPSESNYQVQEEPLSGAPNTWRRKKKKKTLDHRMNLIEHNLKDYSPMKDQLIHRKPLNSYISNFYDGTSDKSVQHRIGKIKLSTHRNDRRMIKDILTPQTVKVMKEYLLKRRKKYGNEKIQHLVDSSSDQMYREDSASLGNSWKGSIKVSHPLRFFPASFPLHTPMTANQGEAKR